MRFLTVTELKQKATQIISEIESTKEEVVITKNGKPVVLIHPVSNSDFALKEEAGEKKLRGMKDSERMKDLVELAKKLKNDPEVGKTARTVLSVHRSLVRSEKKEEAIEKEYKKLEMEEGVKGNGKKKK